MYGIHAHSLIRVWIHPFGPNFATLFAPNRFVLSTSNAFFSVFSVVKIGTAHDPGVGWPQSKVVGTMHRNCKASP